jgi:hypothetical protein
MSIKRRDLIRYFEENAFRLLREGANHSIYTNDVFPTPWRIILHHFHPESYENKK